jgi:hypothetical protein
MAFAASAHAAEQAIGTVMGVPMWELESFIRANATPRVGPFGRTEPANDVRVLHVAPEFNSAIATVALTQRGTSQPAASVYFPTFGNGTMARLYRQINAEDQWSFPQLIGEGYTAVMKVTVQQPYTGSFVPGKTRFMLIPADALSEIVAANLPGRIRPVHRQRAHIGGGDMAVALVAIDPSGLLASDTVTIRVPGQVYPVDLSRTIRSLNSNAIPQGLDPSAGAMALIEVR